MKDLFDVDRAEVRRYLGIKGADEIPQLSALIEQAIVNVGAAASPRFLKREMPLECGDTYVKAGTYVFNAVTLAQHVMGCDKVIVFAATLGSEVDRLILRDSVVSPSLAVAEQAVAAAMIEQYCDMVCDELEMPYRDSGKSFRSRFSPGYGDFSLDAQPTILSLLEASKRIGLTLTDSGMMTPMKSVTALIGIGPFLEKCHAHDCELCNHKTCAFRKEQ